MQETRERKIALDIMRIIAVLAVVMIHTTSDFVKVYEVGSAEFLYGNIFDSMSRLGVPLFIMISGALMLDETKNLSVQKLFGKNIKSMVWLLIGWSAFYDLIYQIVIPVLDKKELNIRKIAEAFLYGHYHMWYLYMIIGLYLITPFLRSFVRKENKNMVLLFMGISLLVQFTGPLLQELSLVWDGFRYINKWMSKFHLQFFCGETTYYLAGWYLVHVGIEKKWKRYGIYLAALSSMLITILYTQSTGDYKNAYSRLNLLIFIYAVGVFLAVNSIEWKINERLKKGILLFSKMSFGIYIIHPMIQTELEKISPYSGQPLRYIFSSFFLIFVISSLVCYVGAKVPGLKKMIRM